MQLHMMNILYLGGLREDLRAKVLEDEANIGNVQDSVKKARAMEILLKDKALKGSIISSIENNTSEGGKDPTPPAAEEDKVEEQILAALEKIKMDNGNYSINAQAANDLRNKLHRGGQQRPGKYRGGG